MKTNRNHYCVIMAGGIGSRFWPVSRDSRPKQFLDILGTGRTFIQATYDRFCKIIPKDNIIVVTSVQHAALVKEQLPDLPMENILSEPYRRNTAPCIAYAVYKLRKRNPDASVVVAPCDHLILDSDLFLKTIEAALDFTAVYDRLYTIGIEPTRPDTNYGYIQTDRSNTRDVAGTTGYMVKTFTEKPDEELARKFVDSGEFLWNSGIFIWKVTTIIREMEQLLPEVAGLFERGEDCFDTDGEQKYVEMVYRDCPKISIDYGVMEKTQLARVLPGSFGWSDLGTWTSLYQIARNKDAAGNVVRAADGVGMVDKKLTGTMVISYEKGKLVVVKGLDNYLVVNTDDVLLICPKDDASVKNVITDLSMSNDKQEYL